MTLHSYVGALITRDGLRALEHKIRIESEELRESGVVNGDRNARGCGNSTSKRIIDEVTRQHDTKRIRIADFTKLRDEATVVDTPTTCDVLGIGLVGHFSLQSFHEDGTVARSEHKTIHVVGFNESDCDSTPQQLSYQAPLIASFIGQSTGWMEEVTIRKIEYEMTLDKITFP